MTERQQNLITYGVPFVVAVAFAIFMAFSMTTLAHIQNDMRRNVGANMLWVLSQAESASLRFDEEVARRTNGDTGNTDIRLRYDILLSRLKLLSQGRQSRYLEKLGMANAIADKSSTIRALEPQLGKVRPGAAAIAEKIHATVEPLNALLGQAANAAMVRQWEESGGRLDQYRTAVLEVIGAAIGIMLSGLFLATALLMALNKARAAERLLRKEKEFSDLLINSSGEGIIALDERLRCILVNPGMKRLFGATQQDFDGKDIAGISSFFAATKMRAAFEGALAGKDTFVGEASVGRANGDAPLYVDVACFPLCVDGKVAGIIAFIRDVTERHAAQRALMRHSTELEHEVRERTQELEQARQYLISAIDTAPDGFAAFDNNGRLAHANQHLQNLLPPNGFLLEDGTPIQQVLDAVGALAITNEPAIFNSDARNTGEVRADLHMPGNKWFQMTVRPIKAGGTVMRLADVTPYKITALALEDALEKEQSISEVYRSFAAMTSHQFRTPLAIIDSSVQRLARRAGKVGPDEIAERAARIRAAVTKMTCLIDSTLGIAHVNAAQERADIANCDVVALVAQVCAQQGEAMPERRIVLTCETPTIEAGCDPVLIEQIVANLVSNALKYSAPTEPVDVKLWTADKSFYCAVKDHGIGIPADEVPHVFDRFFRARTAHEIKGSGLGLNLAHHLARMHDGDVTVESREGAGSTFTMRLPLASRRHAARAA